MCMDVNIYKALQQPRVDDEDDKKVALINMCSIDNLHTTFPEDPIQQLLAHWGSKMDIEDNNDSTLYLLETVPLPRCNIVDEEMTVYSLENTNNVSYTLILSLPAPTLKPLLAELKYV